MSMSWAFRFCGRLALGASTVLAICVGLRMAAADELPSCAVVFCRQAGPVRLTGDDGKAIETRIRAPNPIVREDRVTVLAGETVYIEAAMRDGRLVDLAAVAANGHPERTLVIALSQEPGRPDMMLQITNPFPQPVKYHALMVRPGTDGLYETSSCPVMGDGRGAFEMWPNAIYQLVLFDFRLLDKDGASMSCEY
jgi:hypothetical protein